MRTFLAILLVAVPAFAAESPYGEAVPDGALQRLGSTRFRADGWIVRAFYTKDDKAIVACTATAAVVWDADSGRRLKAVAFDDKPNVNAPRIYFAYDAARHRLACAGPAEADPNSAQVQYWDLNAGAKLFTGPAPATTRDMEWTPDGRLVAMAWDQSPPRMTVEVRDGRGAVLNTWPAPGPADGSGGFRVIDDKRVLVAGGNARVSIVDLATGEEVRALETTPNRNRYPLLATSRDGKFAAVGSQPQCEIFETATGTKTAAIPGDDQSPGHRLEFSPDAKTIYYNTLEKEGFDIASGKPCFDIRLQHASGGMVAGLSHDGRRILCFNSGSPALYQIDTKTGKEIDPPPGHEPRAHTVWMPGNKGLLVRAPNENTWSVWNLQSGRRERQFEIVDPKGNGYSLSSPIRLSADGKELLDLNSAGMLDGAALAFDTATGAVKKRFFAPDHALHSVFRMAYDSDARRVLSWDYDRVGQRYDRRLFTWWNLDTDKKEGGFEIEQYSGGGLESAGPYIAVGPGGAVNRDPDEPAEVYPNAVRLHRGRDGKLARLLEHPNRTPAMVSSSADCELVLTQSHELSLDGPAEPIPPVPGEVRDVAAPVPPGRWHLWEVASGKEIAHWDKPAWDARGGAFPAQLSPAGRYVVQAAGPDSFAVFEPFISQKAIAILKVPSKVVSFSFSPDGKRLATGLADTTVVIWDTAPWEAAVAREVAPPADLATLAEALAEPADRANAALRQLVAAGERAVKLLKEKIPPAKTSDGDQLRKWIADLDAPRFTVREKASKELTALGARAETALRAELNAKPNPEVRARIQKLLSKLEAQNYDAAGLRDLRAVRVLREIDTPAARALLGEWAKGEESAPLTRAAQRP